MNKILADVAILQYGKSPNNNIVLSSSYKIWGTGGTTGFADKPLFKWPFVLISRKGTIDRPTYIENDSWVIDTAYALHSKNNNSLKFLYYYLSSINLLKYNEASGVPSLNRELLYKIPVPSLTEANQNKIATILENADDCIYKTQQNISKLQSIKSGLMQDLFDENKYCDWTTTTLENVRSNAPYSFAGGPFGSDLKNEDYVDNPGIRVIQLQNIGDGEFISDNKIFTSLKKADELKKCNIYPGEIIIAKMADPLARACIIPSEHDRYLMCSDGIRLSVNSYKYDTYFIMNLINHYLFRRKTERIGTGTTRLRIGLTDLKNITFKCPDIDTQKEISKKINNISDMILNEKKVLSKYLKIKQGLMQDLLTGKKEVKVDE